MFENIILPNVEAKTSFKRERDELALKLGYFAGIRAHELVSNGNFTLARMEKLIPRDTSVLLDDHLTVLGKGSKVRKLPLWPELVSSLHKFLYGIHRKKLKENLFEDGRGKPLCDEQYASDVFRKAINNYLTIIKSIYAKSSPSPDYSVLYNSI